MHRCLSCNQTCSISSIFCDSCRLSLLQRSTENVHKEQGELIKVGKVEAGKVHELSSLQGGGARSQEDAAFTGLQTEPESAVSGEEKQEWPARASKIYTMGGANEMEEGEKTNGISQSTNRLATPLSARRPLPKKVRRALLFFCIVGSLALLTDGILLALTIVRHYATFVPPYGRSGMIIPQGAVTPDMGPTQSPAGRQINAAHLFFLSSSRLTFASTQDQASPSSQEVTLFSGGQDMSSWIVVAPGGVPNWLQLSAMQGTVRKSVSATFLVSVQSAHLTPGLYNSTLLVKAFDSHGKVLMGSPETLVVTLNVLVPCTLNVTPTKLSFAAVLLSAPAPRTLTLQAGSTCVSPLSWQASADASWVTFSRSSGTEAGPGTSDSITVQASSAGQLIGSYTAHITLVATDSTGTPVNSSPSTITVTLTVLG